MKFWLPLFDAEVSPQRRLWRWLCVGLLLLACSYRVWLVFHFNPLDHLWSDPKRHWDQGIDVLRNDPMSMEIGRAHV